MTFSSIVFKCEFNFEGQKVKCHLLQRPFYQNSVSKEAKQRCHNGMKRSQCVPLLLLLIICIIKATVKANSCWSPEDFAQSGSQSLNRGKQSEPRFASQ